MLVSNVNDLARWDAALRTDALLKKTILEQMWTPTKLSKSGDADYGFGWSIGKVNGHRLLAHGGGIPGFSTQLSRYLDDNLTVVVLTNSENGNASALARGIAGRSAPALAEKPQEPIADTDPQTTERLKGVILAAMKGEADPDVFTKDSKEKIVAAIKQGKATTASFGAMKDFRLHERKQSDQGVKLRYRESLRTRLSTRCSISTRMAKLRAFGFSHQTSHAPRLAGDLVRPSSKLASLRTGSIQGDPLQSTERDSAKAHAIAPNRPGRVPRSLPDLYQL